MGPGFDILVARPFSSFSLGHAMLVGAIAMAAPPFVPRRADGAKRFSPLFETANFS